ncbi:uncharacterized protein BO88DRAFT_300218, partial [Aspergillus vadensis CBS 113365]
VKDMLQCLREDLICEDLIKILKKYARAILFFIKDYIKNSKDIINNIIFIVNSRELVLVKDIKISSLCKYYLMLFIGKI